LNIRWCKLQLTFEISWCHVLKGRPKPYDYLAIQNIFSFHTRCAQKVLLNWLFSIPDAQKRRYVHMFTHTLWAVFPRKCPSSPQTYPQLPLTQLNYGPTLRLGSVR
jgi:hypothetical protein